MCYLIKARGPPWSYSLPLFYCDSNGNMETTNNVTACIFYSKNDDKLTGRSCRPRDEKVLLVDLEYADDTSILLDNCEDPTNGANSIVTHVARFGMEVHTGKIEPLAELKTEILFCLKLCSMYKNPDSYNNADLPDIIVSKCRSHTNCRSFLIFG